MHDPEGAANDLPSITMSTSAPSTWQGLLRSTIAGSNSMPTETKNSTANASCIGSASAAALMADARLAHHDAREERPERKRHPEQRRRADRDAECDSASTPSVNSSRDPVGVPS